MGLTDIDILIIGTGHFNNQEVPEQVNAMIERFLTVEAIS